MRLHKSILLSLAAALIQTVSNAAENVHRGRGAGPLSPTALSITADGRVLYVACATANQVLVVSGTGAGVIQAIDLPANHSGLTLSSDETRLYVTCAAPTSVICLLDTATTKITSQISAGHTSVSPVLSPD